MSDDAVLRAIADLDKKVDLYIIGIRPAEFRVPKTHSNAGENHDARL